MNYYNFKYKTNIALALKKETAIAENIRKVWLGSNYPKPGEHNHDWDIPSMNYILDVDILFEMVTVRYGEPSGTTAVRVTQAQILHRMVADPPRPMNNNKIYGGSALGGGITEGANKFWRNIIG